MKYLARILALAAFLPGAALAQTFPGQLPALSVWGNPTGSPAPPTSFPIFSTANTWSQLQTLTNSLRISGPANIQAVIGVNTFIQTYGTLVAAQAAAPEVQLLLSMASSIGYTATPSNNFKNALQVFMTVSDGSSDGWASNFACSIAANETHGVGCVALEADINNFVRNYSGAPASANGPFIAGVVSNNGGGFWGHAGYVVTSALPAFYYGYAVFDYTSSGTMVQQAAFFDNGKSTYVLQDTGTHTTGIDLTAATISGNAFASSNYSVTGAGVVTGASYKLGALAFAGNNGSFNFLSDQAGNGNVFLGATSNLYRQTTHTFQSIAGGATYLAIGPGVQVGVPTGGDKGAGTLNIQGTIWANGTQGVTCNAGFSATTGRSVNGIVTAC